MLEDAFRNVLVVAVYCSPHFFANNTAEDKLSAVFRGRRIIKNIQLTPVKKKKRLYAFCAGAQPYCKNC